MRQASTSARYYPQEMKDTTPSSHQNWKWSPKPAPQDEGHWKGYKAVGPIGNWQATKVICCKGYSTLCRKVNNADRTLKEKSPWIIFKKHRTQPCSWRVQTKSSRNSHSCIEVGNTECCVGSCNLLNDYTSATFSVLHSNTVNYLSHNQRHPEPLSPCKPDKLSKGMKVQSWANVWS